MMLSAQEVLAVPADFDVREVYRPGDPCIHWFGGPMLQAIYRVKYQVARYLRPCRLLEIGVRAGYSAAAFLAARPDAHYVGLDRDDGSHGGVVGYLEGARCLLLDRYPDAWVEVYPWDSQEPSVRRRLRSRWTECFDLAHIDGDHSEEGCLGADLVWPGGHLLVDDYDLLAEVRRAADRFVREAGYQAVRLPSPHGDLLVRKTVGMEGNDAGAAEGVKP